MSNNLIKKLNKPILVDKNMPDFGKDPFFEAKNEKAEKFIAENGLPKDFKTKPKAKGSKRKA
jgi:hypothetical protein